MENPSKRRSAFKFLFWTAVSAGLFAMAIQAHLSGQLSAWYYHTAGTAGYAVNADTFKKATKDNPAWLVIGDFKRIEGLQAVPVKKGDGLPSNANGVIDLEVLKEGKRAVVERDRIRVMVPWKMLEAKGFKYKDTFKHKGVETYPWAALWNVFMVIALGIALGYMAEGFTDFLGIKLEKIRHFEGH